MLIIFLSDKCEPIDLANTVIVAIVSIRCDLFASPFNVAVNKILGILLLNPLAFFNQIKQELSGEEPLIHSVVDAQRLIT